MGAASAGSRPSGILKTNLPGDLVEHYRFSERLTCAKRCLPVIVGVSSVTLVALGGTLLVELAVVGSDHLSAVLPFGHLASVSTAFPRTSATHSRSFLHASEHSPQLSHCAPTPTMSPTLTWSTLDPTLTATPTSSCPVTTGHMASPQPADMVCKSEAHCVTMGSAILQQVNLEALLTMPEY
jgi:hypothetical protein